MLKSKTGMKKSRFGRIARLLVVVYAVVITVAVALAATIGPFQESFALWTRASILETRLKESQRERGRLEEERTRVLNAIKKLQADWAAGQETIRTLREMTKNPEVEQKLLEANRSVEKSNEERMVLITKLTELQEELKACKSGKK
ncbi:MAG: hypothetical protein HYU99_10385 [Deltaproteobacteria bacterium]|nr:hypothetical protein [Deltaproteobacteria bacterium]